MTTKGPFIQTKVSPWRDLFRGAWWAAALSYVLVVLVLDLGGTPARLASVALFFASVASLLELAFFREQNDGHEHHEQSP